MSGPNGNTVSNLIVPFVGSGLVNDFTPPSSPNLQGPNTLSSTPTQAQTNTTALQTQLSKEQTASSTSSILTGGQGLLDQPSTTSRVLLGS